MAHVLDVRGHVAICRRLPSPWIRPPALTALRCPAAMAGVLALCGTAGLSPLEWVAGPVGGTVAFAAILVGLRAVTRSALRHAPAWLLPGRA